MSNEYPSEGTHDGGPRPFDGWPNTKDPEARAGRRTRKARARLEVRRKDFDSASGNQGRKRPGSLKG